MDSLYQHETALEYKGVTLYIPSSIRVDQRNMPRCYLQAPSSWEGYKGGLYTEIRELLMDCLGTFRNLARYRVVYVLQHQLSIIGLDIHHIDFNPLNDNWQNLLALHRADHKALHNKLGDNHFEDYRLEGSSKDSPLFLSQPTLIKYSSIIIS